MLIRAALRLIDSFSGLGILGSSCNLIVSARSDQFQDVTGTWTADAPMFQSNDADPVSGFCQFLNGDFERMIVCIGKIQVTVIALIIKKVKNPPRLTGWIRHDQRGNAMTT